jgi:hypothetical protein
MLPSTRVRPPLRGFFFLLFALGLLGLAFACGESEPDGNGGTGGDGGSGSLCEEACEVGLLCLPDGQGSHSCRCTVDLESDSCLALGPHSLCNPHTRRCDSHPGTGGSGGGAGHGGTGGAGGSGGGGGLCGPGTFEDPACQACLEDAIPACFGEVSGTCSAEITAVYQCAAVNGCIVAFEPDVECTLQRCPAESMAMVLCMRRCEPVAACF